MWNPSAVWTAAQSIVLAQAEEGAGEATNGAAQQGPMGGIWIFFIAMLAIMYFFLFRPQQKREKERREMLSSLTKGAKVMTSGGIIGTIVGLSEKTVVLRVSEEPLLKMEFARGSISKVLSEGDEDDDDDNE